VSGRDNVSSVEDVSGTALRPGTGEDSLEIHLDHGRVLLNGSGFTTHYSTGPGMAGTWKEGTILFWYYLTLATRPGFTRVQC
jgi:hypothetical protein